MRRGLTLIVVLLLWISVPAAQTPARIVSTSPSITETLFALGLENQVVGVSTYCRFPPEVSQLPKVGTFLRPSPELIARLTPSLVILPLTIYIGTVVALALAIVHRARQWNLLSVSEAWAATRGTPVTRLLFGGYASGSILAATTVALTGPIGFIGLVVPHLVRTRVGVDDRVVMPCAFLMGGVLLAACDALGRVVLAPAEVPAGAITALVGGPYLVWLIRHRTA